MRSIAVWITLGLSVVALAVIAAFRKGRGGRSADLGWVTEHWLAEHRADESSRSH